MVDVIQLGAVKLADRGAPCGKREGRVADPIGWGRGGRSGAMKGREGRGDGEDRGRGGVEKRWPAIFGWGREGEEWRDGYAGPSQTRQNSLKKLPAQHQTSAAQGSPLSPLFF